MSESREELEARARNAILQHAFMRWESAGVLAASFLATFITSIFSISPLGIPSWTYLVGGIAAYTALVYSSFSDDEANAKVVEELLRQDFSPKQIKNPKLQSKIQEALDYRSRITDLINQRKDDSALKTQLLSMADQFDVWIEEIYDLAQRLDAYEDEKPLLHESAENAQRRITQLTKRLNRVRDDKVKDEIRNNINNLNQQLDTIESLHNTMHRAELRLENTLTAMGTIYPQTLLLKAKDIDRGRWKRLQQEIDTEVDELSDILYAMDEVYSESEI